MKNYQLEVGTFITPPDAHHIGILDIRSLEKAWAKIGSCFGYLKPDGWRIQLHVSDRQIKLFSRTKHDEALKEFSALGKDLLNQLSGKTMILDVEVIGIDRNGEYTPLRRIRDATRHIAKVLDVLWVDNQDFTQSPTIERQEILHRLLNELQSTSLVDVDYHRINSFDELSRLYQTFLDQTGPGFDGVILKSLSKSYFSPAYKLKREITIDVVIVGIYLGKASKTINSQIVEFPSNISLLMAVMDAQTQQWIPIGKVNGNDDDWKEVLQKCQAIIIEGDRPAQILAPPDSVDMWVRPEVVVQVTARTISLGAKNSYVVVAEAPREVFLRPEKDVNLATTFDQLLVIGDIKKRPVIPMGLI
jgi:ATP-dependent DNA ligase